MAGLAVFPLVGLMTAARVMRDNYARLMQDLGTGRLPHPVMSMAEFKTFIGFEEIEERQAKYLVMDIQPGLASG